MRLKFVRIQRGELVGDARGMIQASNAAAEALLQRRTEELQDLPLAAISDQDRWQRALDKARGGEAARLTLGMGGNTILCDVAPVPDLRAPTGDAQRLVVVLQDISDDVRERRSQMEGIALLAEDRRTPITTIINYADVLLGALVGLLGHSQRKFVLQIKAGAQSILQIASALST